MWIKGFEVDLKIYVAIAYLDKSFGIFSKKKKKQIDGQKQIERLILNRFVHHEIILNYFVHVYWNLPGLLRNFQLVFKHGSLNLKSQ